VAGYTADRRTSLGRATAERRLSATFSAPSEGVPGGPAALSATGTPPSDSPSGAASAGGAEDGRRISLDAGPLPWLRRTLSRQSSRSSTRSASTGTMVGAAGGDISSVESLPHITTTPAQRNQDDDVV
jgi:hypothetical protein